MLYFFNQNSNRVAYLKTSANEFLIFESYLTPERSTSTTKEMRY